MIRARIPRRDDRTILDLVKSELLPFTLRTKPQLRWDASEVRRRLNRNVTFVAAPKRLEAIGFASVKKTGNVLHLDMLAVNRNSQGRGWGSALLKESERYARGHGCQAIRLFVDEENGKARSFYARHGYAEQMYYPTLRCIAMGKTL